MKRRSTMVPLLCLGMLSAMWTPASASPVEKVVHLLEDMKSGLQADEKAEQRIYDRYACWCEKATKKKATDIEDAQLMLRSLAQKILSTKGRIEVLENEIAELEEKIEDNIKAQEEATSTRQKDNAAFMAMQAETKEALTAMEQAIIVLRNATTPGGIKAEEAGAALVQQKERTQTGLAAVRSVIEKLPSFGSFKPEQVSMLSEFMSAGNQAKYTPQSGTVQGILKDMYDTFAKDLEKATFEEGVANRDYENFMHTKAVELAAFRKEKAEKEAEKAEQEERLASTQASYDDTEEAMKADIEFFDETKKGCELKHKEWETRSSLRAEEILGIKKALTILTSDEARDLFAKSITAGKETGASDKYNTGVNINFLQLASAAEAQDAGDKAYKALKDKSRQTHSIRLAALAVEVRMAKAGHFDKVIKEIGDMIQLLKDEAAADVKKYDQCKDQYFKIDKQIGKVTWLIKNNNIRIEKLTSEIGSLEEEVAVTEQKITETNYLMGNMTATRQSENQEFHSNKKDDQDAIKLLTQARDVLGSYYANHSVDYGPTQGSVKAAMFLQLKEEPEFEVDIHQAPEAEFSGSGNRKYQAKGVLQILEYIIMDLNDEIRNDMAAEEETQLQYEKAMDAAKKYRGELILRKIDLQDAIAKLKEDRTEENKKLRGNKFDLKDEQDYKASIKPDCDWIMKAFHPRAEGRAAELKGLTEAKEFLSEWASSDKSKSTYTQESDADLGATYGSAAAMLQKAKPSSDLTRIRFLGVRPQQ